MKKVLFTILTITALNFSFAQDKVQVSESNETFSTGSVNSFSVIVHGGDLDVVTKAWKKQLKDIKGSVKAKKEIFADDCRIKKMSDNVFDVYSRIEPAEGGVKIIAAYDLGGAYLSSNEHSVMLPYVKDMMYKFAVAETKEAVGAVIKDEEKKLKDLNGEKEDIEKSTEDLKKDIDEYKRKIEEAEKNIKENEGKVSAKSEEIKAQEGVIQKLEAKQKAVK